MSVLTETTICLTLVAIFSFSRCQPICSESKTLFELIPREVAKCQKTSQDETAQSYEFMEAVLDHPNITDFHFNDFEFTALKRNTFQNISNGGLKSLVLENVKLDLIFEPPYADPEEKYTLFADLEELTTLIVTNCELAYGWDFGELYDSTSQTGLSKLENIHMQSNKLYYVDEKLLNLAEHPRYISIENCQVYWTERIKNTDKLVWFSLSNNRLEEIPDNFIGNDAPNLWYLDLSQNQLQTIPDDLTVNAKELRELNLSKNKLITVSPSVLERVWDNLDALWIHDNTLHKMTTNELCWYIDKTKDSNYYLKPMYWYMAEIFQRNQDKCKT